MYAVQSGLIRREDWMIFWKFNSASCVEKMANFIYIKLRESPFLIILNI